MTRGIVLCAFGDASYLDMATRLSHELRTAGVLDKITIFVDDGLAALKCDLPHDTVLQILDPVGAAVALEWHVPADASRWDRCGLLPKLLMPLCTPYDDTIFMDADMHLLRQWDPWTALGDPATTTRGGIVCPGLADEKNLGPKGWHWGGLHEVSRAAGFPVPQVFSTLVRFAMTPEMKVQYKVSMGTWLRSATALRIQRRFRSGYPDEIFYALWLGQNNDAPDRRAHDALVTAGADGGAVDPFGGKALSTSTLAPKVPTARKAPGNPFPMVIWSYWDPTNVTRAEAALFTACVESWKRWNPAFAVEVLHPDTIHRVGITAEQVAALQDEPYGTDAVGIFALAAYGGVWCRPNVFCSKPFDAFPNEKWEVTGYFLEQGTKTLSQPAVMSWWIAALPGTGPMLACKQALILASNAPSRAISRGKVSDLRMVRAGLVCRALQNTLWEGGHTQTKLGRVRLSRAEDGPLFYAVLAGMTPRADPSLAVLAACLRHEVQLGLPRMYVVPPGILPHAPPAEWAGLPAPASGPRPQAAWMPRTVWILWLQGWGTAPWLQRQVAQSWVDHNPTWTIQTVDKASLRDKWLREDAAYMWDPEKRCSPQAQSDIIRLSLLNKYGGVWADATMLCLRPLDEWLVPGMLRGGLWMHHGQGGGMTTDVGPASWFIVSLPGHYVIRAWKAACDAFWAKTPPTRVQYFWMDMLFKDLWSKDDVFRGWWAEAPFVDCNAPGQIHSLTVPATLRARNDALMKSMAHAPPVAVKLKHSLQLEHPEGRGAEHLPWTQLIALSRTLSQRSTVSS